MIEQILNGTRNSAVYFNMALLGQQQGEQLLSHCIIDIAGNDLGFIIRVHEDQGRKKKKRKNPPLKKGHKQLYE